MNASPEPSPDLARRIENGEYYREAHEFYNATYVDPLSERYFYMLVTAVALIVAFMVFLALAMLLPLSTPVPFTTMSQNVFEELPRVRPIGARGEDPNLVLTRFMASEYVQRREAYDAESLEFNVRFVKAQSSPELFEAWQAGLDPAKPESPISRYQRHSRRLVKILSAVPDGADAMRVTFETGVTGQSPAPFIQRTARVRFQFDPVTVDQISGKATPLKFVVTDYQLQ